MAFGINLHSQVWRSPKQTVRLLKTPMASVASTQPGARMSRFEPDRYIDYSVLDSKIKQVQARLRKPLTFSEKIVYGHLDNIEEADIHRGESYLKLRPTRIACQDATAQMALIQFMSAGLDSIKVPTTIHCDHLIPSHRRHKFADGCIPIRASSIDRSSICGPFEAWAGNDYNDLAILIKVEGKYTTDHITPAGSWFRYRGDLDNIANNTLIGAVNADDKKLNSIRNVFTGKYDGVPETARDYKARGQQWVVIAEHNYGEGYSREHAALQPRFLSGVSIIAKSFARIHESNLKKQGMLPLTFGDASAYDRIEASDRVSIKGLAELSPGRPVEMLITRPDGSTWSTMLDHTINEEQIGYFRAGSALNLMAQADAGSTSAHV